MTKGLKMFVKESSIRKELEKWSAKDIAEYLNKHSNDKKRSKLLQKKINIVWDYLFKEKKFTLDSLKELTNDIANTKTLINNEAGRDILLQYPTIIIDKIFADPKKSRLLLNNTEYVKTVLNQENLLERLATSDLIPKFIAKNVTTIQKKENTDLRLLLQKCYKINDQIDLDCLLLPNNLEKREKDTAKKLIKSGYGVVKFLGAGSFGVVWECVGKNNKHKAVKVFTGEHSKGFTAEELENSNQLRELFKEEKERKYFNLLRQKKNNPTILKTNLAQGDLVTINSNTKTSSKPGGKTLNNVLKKAKQALQSVALLHKKGYSHNDIKPENFLKINNWESKKNKLEAQKIFLKNENDLEKINSSNNNTDRFKKLCEFIEQNKINEPKIENIKKSNDNDKKKADDIFKIIEHRIKNKIKSTRLQLADFGTLSPIPKEQTGFYMPVGTPAFISPTEFQKYFPFGSPKAPKEEIEKRDVYALGMVLIFLLLGKYINNHETEYTSTIHNLPLSDVNKLKENKWYKQIKDIYERESDDRMCEFLMLIKNMTMIDYKHRINIEKALEKLNAIK